jgi:hypothetical protein
VKASDLTISMELHGDGAKYCNQSRITYEYCGVMVINPTSYLTDQIPCYEAK